MKIISFQPKDIYVTIEFSLAQLKQLQVYLSGSEFKYNSEEEPEAAAAAEYIANELYPELVSFLDEMEKA